MSSAAHEWSGEVDDLDPAGILAAFRANEARIQQGEADKSVLALQWCAVNPPEAGMGFSNWGDHTCLDGAFNDDESLGVRANRRWRRSPRSRVATVLGVSTHSGMQLIADALDLAHRLPVWRARKAAEAQAAADSRLELRARVGLGTPGHPSSSPSVTPWI